ncbi:GNAT family N-acetyltransferase [Crossiella sp. CA-258035]|uniref:GNAT family N-acetyltransferase n=1 Tax=Crossiella sp. CA-258035 TaxID=2981138 RepID=UPI0024BD17AB|nr:GNAT family N-acetyltransferase [Crossiella sp. CA-258035]WHT17386.1 GNAT family N-acetyltransferase [Crossiella sp. CA-258035]
MTLVGDLLAAQTAHFAGLDPLLPPAAGPVRGDAVSAALPDGGRVAGMVELTEYPPGSANRLWSAARVWELVPVLGASGRAGMDALLRAWQHRMAGQADFDPDSACVLNWPSRDVAATRALLDHGLVPLSVLAVRERRESAAPSPGPLTVRRARQADLGAAVELSMLELAYSALVGSAVVRPDAAALKREALANRLRAGDPVWLAEHDGVPVGLAECGWTDSGPRTAAAARLPRGRWGYVNCVSVLPGARGSGVGQLLMAAAHAEFAAAGVAGSYLYFNPPNPLSSVFWSRQGYRPLWTMWEIRPAGALR